jgi:uncharacterized repeat protein (TIGR03803 family)
MPALHFTFRAVSERVSLLCLASLLLVGGQMATAQTETVLYSFCTQANCADGGGPLAGVILDAKGNVYGTAQGGPNAYGTVFQLTPSGTETVLHSFPANAADGMTPWGGVVMDGAGNLYGTTSAGGTGNCQGGCGTVFEITSSGTETVLHSFTYSDGFYPTGSVALDTLGNVYGATYGGGAHGRGTVYKLAPSGTETVLHSFGGGGKGCYPYLGNLVLGKNKVLYGTTSKCGAYGGGVVFAITQSGKETILHSFSGNSADGTDPLGSVVLDEAGNIYGTTRQGGSGTFCEALYGCGTVYRVTPGGIETVLYSFCSQANCEDGGGPMAGVILDANGNLYGTTTFGGTGACEFGCGTVFKIGSSSVETVVHSFTDDGKDGFLPYWDDGVVLDNAGNLYGTTYMGGAKDYGTVFKIVP